MEKSLKVVFTWAALALFTHGLTELVLATVCRHLALLIQSLQRCESPFKQAFFMVHPQNVRFQNVRFQNVRFQNVGNVRFTKRQVYKTSGLQNVRFTKRQVFKTSGCKKHPYIFCTCGWWKSAGYVAAMFAGKVVAVFYFLFLRFFCLISP